jgi:hypothetical protein
MLEASIADITRVLGQMDAGVGGAAASEKRHHGSSGRGASGGGVSAVGAGGSATPPEGDPDPKSRFQSLKERLAKQAKGEFKRKDFVKGDKVDLDRFTQRQSQSGQRARQVDPRTGDYLDYDYAAKSGRAHGGSYWKLYSRRNEPLGAFTEEGVYLRPITKPKG